MIITFSIAKIVKGSRRAGKPLLRRSAVCAPRSASVVCRPPSIFVYSFPIRWRSASAGGCLLFMV